MTEYYYHSGEEEEEDIHDRAQKTYRGIEDMWARTELDRSIEGEDVFFEREWVESGVGMSG